MPWLPQLSSEASGDDWRWYLDSPGSETPLWLPCFSTGPSPPLQWTSAWRTQNNSLRGHTIIKGHCWQFLWGEKKLEPWPAHLSWVHDQDTISQVWVRPRPKLLNSYYTHSFIHSFHFSFIQTCREKGLNQDRSLPLRSPKDDRDRG